MSGCFLRTTNDGDIRKTSPNTEYNSRLEAQAKKQDMFSRFFLKNISVPRVLRSGYESGLFYYDMEYVKGCDFEIFTKSSGRDELIFFCDTIQSYFHDLKSVSGKHNVKETIENKLAMMIRKSKLKKTLHHIIRIVESMPEFKIPITLCHGDMTLSNILFGRNKIFLIDFLDSYVNTFLCDMAKIKQDAFYSWSHRIGNSLDLRSKISLDFVWENVWSEFSEDIDTMEFKVIDCINILRIEPYIKSDIQMEAFRYALSKCELCGGNALKNE